MCFPHIINICVQHVVDEFSAPDLKKIAQAWVDCFDDSAVDKKKYLEAVKRNPLGLRHDIVHAIHASGLQHDKFDKIVVTGNLQQWFRSPAGEVVQLPEAQLLRDIKTQWDSIFYMLNHLLALHLAIDCFLSLPVQKDLANFKMVDMEWLILQEYAKILEIPHKVQQRMLSESQPVLSHAVPVEIPCPYSSTFLILSTDALSTHYIITLALLVDVFSFLSYLSLHSRSTEVRLLYTLFTVILTHVVSCDSCLG
ncbi:hypothetical protein SCLCIDRAFT_110217 [Scleroderma citrinum Foug A]|uniref:Uncharacterized protein n=1 Tax=Scleroderma citrinum Foug A TaxID=1036808 RepID=A0A0C3ANX1_9AGAM|nr:hypothetical protein SCLCIDRAFT_110217 [Scleroderma citrinum Foug A]